MRKIAIITERRADYSRYKPILEKIEDDMDLDYVLYVTGAHLLEKYGRTMDVIINDGYRIDAKIKMYDEGFEDTGAEMSRGIGRVLLGVADELEKSKPDLILTGFDLGPQLAIAIAGAHMNIPVAHIQGGEVTGSIDESLRHAITKFAHIHFPATDDAVERLEKLGEKSKYIFKVGCPSLDSLLNVEPETREKIFDEYGLDPSKPYMILIQHPVTTEVEEGPAQIKKTIEAIKELNLQGIFIFPNTDAGNKGIIKEVEDSDIKHVKFLDIKKYANLLRYASALVGNSSSGIHETASFHVPTINIGTRQQGRLRPESVIDVDYDKEQIKEAINKALYDENFKRIVNSCKNPYGDGKSAEKIVKVLSEIDLDADDLIQKKITY